MVFSLPSIDGRGAIGQNQSEYHDLGFQRPFGNRVVHGLVQQDVNEVSSAILAIEYSFAHQNPDGSFRVVQIPGASYQLNTHNVVGVSFFYADLGHALGLFQESQWFQTSSATATLRARLDGLRQKIRSGLDWLSAPEQQPQVQNTGRRDTNRWTYGAEAYLLVGQWLNDSSAISIGEGLLKGVEGNQQPDGTILEKGGFDSGYQSVSLNNLFHIYLHLGSGLTTLKPDLWNEIRKGLAREQQALLSSGQMTHVGNTRTYCGGEAFRGKPKEGGGHDLARVLTYMYGLTNNGALLTAAETTVAYYANHSHSLC